MTQHNEPQEPLRDPERIHEGTAALQELAAEVEQDREERGRSEFAAPEQPDERAMADAAALSEDAPDADNPTRESHERDELLESEAIRRRITPIDAPGNQAYPR